MGYTQKEDMKEGRRLIEKSKANGRERSFVGRGVGRGVGERLAGFIVLSGDKEPAAASTGTRSRLKTKLKGAEYCKQREMARKG